MNRSLRKKLLRLAIRDSPVLNMKLEEFTKSARTLVFILLLLMLRRENYTQESETMPATENATIYKTEF